MAHGALRFIGWHVPQRCDVAHAFIEHGVQMAPLCSDVRARWDVRARRVRPGDADVPRLCEVCVGVARLAHEEGSREVDALLASRAGQMTIAEAAS